MVNDLTLRLWATCRQQFDEVIHDVAAFDKLQTGLRDMAVGVSVETGSTPKDPARVLRPMQINSHV